MKRGFMAVGNAINEQTTGISGFSGTAFVGSPATQHCVQIGGATSSTLANVTNGTTGQVLTANTGAAPTFQDISSPSASSIVNLFDDFVGGYDVNNSPRYTSSLYWATATSGNTLGGTVFNSNSNAHPGIIQNLAFSTGSVYVSWGNSSTGTIAPYLGLLLGGGAITLTWIINIVNLSNGTNRYILRAGFGDTFNLDMANGVYFEYSDNVNSGNWTYKTADASSRTTSNSSVAVTTGWHNLSLTINAAASSVSFSVDGVSLGTAITTNIPTTNPLTPTLVFRREAGTIAAGTFLIDLFSMTQTLTTPR